MMGRPQLLPRVVRAAALLCCTSSCALGDDIVSTIAGNGTNGYLGDAVPATAATLASPTDMCVDALGNVYISDSVNHRIRRVDAASGLISTIAGTGVGGFSGDFGPATLAKLKGPYGVAVDAAFNVYIADFGNNRVRLVSAADGTIRTIAGNGTRAFTGDGLPGTASGLTGPLHVVLDAAANLFITEVSGHRVRKLWAANQTLVTVAGTGQTGWNGDGKPATASQLAFPWGAYVDAQGQIYIADTSNERVRLVLQNGTMTTVAGNGTVGYFGEGVPATSAMLNTLYGVAMDSTGRLFIADTTNNRIRVVTDGVIRTYCGTGVAGHDSVAIATQAMLNNPFRVVVDSHDAVYVSDFGANMIRKVAFVQPSSSGTGSPTSSVSASPSAAAATTTPTRSDSQSASSSPTLTASSSTSGTPVSTGTGTSTPASSPSASLSGSASSTPPQSESASPSPSPSPPPSAPESRSPSPSGSESVTHTPAPTTPAPSISLAATSSQTVTPSRSRSHSSTRVSRSRSPTQTPSRSHTPKPTQSRTSSPTPSRTRPQSHSRSQSMSPTRSHTAVHAPLTASGTHKPRM